MKECRDIKVTVIYTKISTTFNASFVSWRQRQ